MTGFTGLSPYVFARPSFFSERKLPDDLSWLLNSCIYCIVLTLDVNFVTPSIISSTVILYSSGLIKMFHKIFCSQVVVLSTKPVTKLEKVNGDVSTD